MDSRLFEQLLYEEESTTVDFKKEQYRFSRATDAEKSELLKDILGFCNAWRRTEAYILIGVEDIRGGRGNVVGIQASDHLDDHSLQQFVHSLTNQPVLFHYEAFTFEGKHVGIIRIEDQVRPIYLKRDYGALAKQRVYVRRGSSTDPTKPASPEEIAQMRVGSLQPSADVTTEFANVSRDGALGPKISMEAQYCTMPTYQTIPDYEPRLRFDLRKQPNKNFFRELAEYEFMRRLFRPVRLVITNAGQVAAQNVRIELSFPANETARVIYASELPDPPERTLDLFITPRDLRLAGPSYPGKVSIDENDERFQIEIDCGDLQPGRQVWSDVFYVARECSGDINLAGLVYAGNLPKPKRFSLTVSATVNELAFSVDELCSLSESLVRDE